MVLWCRARSIVNSRTLLTLLGGSQELVQAKNVFLFIFLKLDGTFAMSTTAVSARKLLVRNKSTTARKFSSSFQFKLTFCKLYHSSDWNRPITCNNQQASMSQTNVCEYAEGTYSRMPDRYIMLSTRCGQHSKACMVYLQVKLCDPCLSALRYT